MAGPRGGSKVPDSLAVRKAIDAGRVPPVWLWTGPEEYLKDDLFRHLAGRVVDEATAVMNVNRFRGGEDALDTVLGTCRTFPMLAARRAVLLRDLEKLSRSEREELAAYVAAPAPEAALVLFSSRPPNDSLNRRLAEAGAASAVFWIPFENQTRQWVQIRFRDLGKRCSPETAQALLEWCGGGDGQKVPLAAVAPEIEKVALALGDRAEVTEDDLGVIGRKADKDLLREVVSRVTRRDAAGALRALDGALLFRENHEVRVVATLTHRILNLSHTRSHLDAGLGGRPSGMWPSEWPEIEAGVRRFDRARLNRALLALARADRTLKSSPKNVRIVLEETILTICD